MNIPNTVTLLRILLIPLVIILLVEGKTTQALLVFLAAGIGDALDGFLARTLNQRTELGAQLDPIADKILINATGVTLAVLHDFPAWLAVVMVSRDALIVGGIGVLWLNRYRVDLQPTKASKVTTFVQLATIFFFMGQEHLEIFWPVKSSLVAFTAFFTIFSGGQYLVQATAILGANSTGDQP